MKLLFVIASLALTGTFAKAKANDLNAELADAKDLFDLVCKTGICDALHNKFDACYNSLTKAEVAAFLACQNIVYGTDYKSKDVKAKTKAQCDKGLPPYYTCVNGKLPNGHAQTVLHGIHKCQRNVMKANPNICPKK